MHGNERETGLHWYGMMKLSPGAAVISRSWGCVFHCQRLNDKNILYFTATVTHELYYMHICCRCCCCFCYCWFCMLPLRLVYRKKNQHTYCCSLIITDDFFHFDFCEECVCLCVTMSESCSQCYHFSFPRKSLTYWIDKIRMNWPNEYSIGYLITSVRSFCTLPLRRLYQNMIPTSDPKPKYSDNTSMQVTLSSW